MKIIFFIAGIFSVIQAISQTATNRCDFDAHNTALNQESPGREESIAEQLSRIKNGQVANFSDRTDPIIIPVVVHVIHDGGVSDISFEQILSGIELLNEDFNRLNPDTLNTRNTSNAPFETIAANTGISFELAKIDPDGNCTNGVERRFSPSVTNGASNNAKHYNQGGLDAWNRNDYMNIWIVNSIESDGGGTTLGYAEFPYSGGSSNYGVIIRHDAYGTTGTSTSGERTLTHEIGHCLGLYHTFQGGCHSDACDDNGDHCCDTPPESEAHWSCGSGQNSCLEIPGGDFFGFDALDQWENFMSYAPCQNMFSEDQKTIMLGNLSNITFLSNLVSLSNQAATGIGSPEILCAANFKASNKVICAGSTVNFYDQSYFNILGTSWTFEGGVPAISSDQNPTVTYNVPGIYTVSLEVTDGISTASTTEANYIIVLADTGLIPPYSEGFESFSIFPDNQAFTLQNDNAGEGWEICEEAAYSGSKCLVLTNYSENDGSKDEFSSGPIDLSHISTSDEVEFNFRYAYRKKNPSDHEWLQLYISKDCGQTWVLRKNIHGDDLNTLTQASSYQPTNEDEWFFAEVTNINSAYYVANFRYKFVFTNDNGNNIYIDNIKLYPASMANLEEDSLTPKINIYPNPSSGQISINCVLNKETKCTVEIKNTLGQIVQCIYTGQAAAGDNVWVANLDNLESGIYFICLVTDTGTQTLKFIKE